MKKCLYRLLAISLLITCSIDSLAQGPGRFRPDSLRGRSDTSRQQSDTGRTRRGGGMMSLFADSAKLSTSDYQLQIEKTYVTLDNIDNKSELGPVFNSIKDKLSDNDTLLAVIKDNVLNNAQALNLRNLEVFRTLLQNIQSDVKDWRQLLDSSESQLAELRTDLQLLVRDTVLKQLQRDSVLRLQFDLQLKGMRETWRSATRHLRQSLARVNQLQIQVSSNAITSSQLLEKVNNLLTSSAAHIFSKEYNYLWEKDTSTLSKTAHSSFRRAYAAEKKAVYYYFKDSGHKRLFLLLVGVLFFIWTYRNIRTLRRMKAMENLQQLGFEYLITGYIVSAFVIMFSIAPLFDLKAPSVYIESMQFFLLIILTIICWRKWPRRLFIYWIAMTVLYICFSLTHHIVDPGFWQRCWLILLNILSIAFCLLFLSKMKQSIPLKGFVRFVIILNIVMNLFSIICNITGRYTLAQILGNAAIFAFVQAVGLAIFSKICMEAILLQIVTSRMRRGVQSRFEYQHVLNSFGRLVLFLVVVLWLIVFTTNLNIHAAVWNGLVTILQSPRHLGSASFTIGGVLLFFMIIWIAHLLQKYVGYFFGDTGTEDDLQNKGQRSRLLVARLILLSIGYLLAVAASGIPVDKITIVLGALGVGIGLGLQNIVNNFVSGIVLIFDRPLQIGDLVEIGGKSGRVREIGLRSSTLLTQDGAEVIIPNGDILSQQIVNWTLSNNQQRLEMDLVVSGNKDMEEVASLIKQTILSSSYIFESREPQILFTKINDNGFELKVFFWCADVSKSEQARSEVLVLLHEKLGAANMRVE